MPRKQHKYHYIYKTTNVITNKYYIGMHSTSDLEDGYIGSGQRLWHSINKYGKENHKCEILEYYKDRKELALREKEIVNEDLLKETLCMNLALGGEIGFTYEQLRKGALKMLEIVSKDLEFQKRRSERCKELFKRLYIEGKIKPFDWTGRKHKEETKQKIGAANSIKQKGEGNSRYGTCWIHSLEEKKSISIKKEEIDNWLSKGWNKGRKMNF
jgi:hypothetical protein